MMRKNGLKFICLLALTLLWASAASAHDMWLEENGERVEILYGHPGNCDPFPVSKISDFTGLTPNGWKIQIKPIADKGGACGYLDDDYAMVAATLDNNYWRHTEEEGWLNTDHPVKSDLTIIEEGSSYKIAKVILDWKPFMKKPIGQRMEIVPLKNPTTMKEGEMLPVALFFEGKPVASDGFLISPTSDSSAEHPEMKEIDPAKPCLVKIGPAGRQLVTAKYVLDIMRLDQCITKFQYPKLKQQGPAV